MKCSSDTALILTGGGARGAYQAGVLKAIAEQFPGLHDPFPILCGSSAGALNAVGLASGPGIFRHGVERLEYLWETVTADRVYRNDLWGMTRSFARFARALIGADNTQAHASLLNNQPLREFLARQIDFDALNEAIRSKRLRAMCVTACGYASGQSVSFFQAGDDVKGWHLGQRVGVRTTLTLDHLLASSAIPLVFPPVHINREYFGDGVTRQMAPLSPAIHLGARRLLIVSVSANRACAVRRESQTHLPSIPRILEHILNALFLDTIDNDIDRALTMNELLMALPEKERRKRGLKPLEILVISPSQPINDIARHYLDRLPLPLRRALGGGSTEDTSASLASYLLFDPDFCKALIRLGYEDAKAHAKMLDNFITCNDDSV